METGGPEKYYTTVSGLRRFIKRLEKARQDYIDVCETNEEAAGAGDVGIWHDNFSYEENQRLMHQLAHNVKSLEKNLELLIVAPVAKESPEQVVFGCKVKITFLDDGSDREYFIAGFEDGDPNSGRLSYTSPLAQAIMGAREGEIRTVHLAGRSRDLEITKVSPAPEGEE